MHRGRVAMELPGISLFMFPVATFVATRNGTNVIEGVALAATCAAIMATFRMDRLTIFPRGKYASADNLGKSEEHARSTAMAVTAVGIVATLMGGIIPL